MKIPLSSPNIQIPIGIQSTPRPYSTSVLASPSLCFCSAFVPASPSPCPRNAFISTEPSLLFIRNQESLPNIACAENNNVQRDEDVEFIGNAMIKGNNKLFKLVSAVTNFVQLFPFREECLTV